MHEPITSVQLSKIIIYGAFAILGGVVHALIAQRKGLTKGVSDLIALSFDWGSITGGTQTTDGSYTVCQFNSSSSLVLTAGGGGGATYIPRILAS